MYEYSQLCYFTLEVNVPLPSNVRNNSSLVYTSFNKTQLCIEKWLYSRPHLTGEREPGTKTNDVFSYSQIVKEESYISLSMPEHPGFISLLLIFLEGCKLKTNNRIYTPLLTRSMIKYLIPQADTIVKIFETLWSLKILGKNSQ